MKLLDQLQMFFYTNLITNKTKKILYLSVYLNLLLSSELK